MKLLKIILVLLPTILYTSCNADNAAHLTIDSSFQKETGSNPTITLNCQDFKLGYEDGLLCNYWQKSNYLSNGLDIKYFTKYREIHPISDLGTSDYAYYATASLILDGITYYVNIYPSSWISLENPNKKVKSKITGELENETNYYICQSPKCRSMFLWDYSDEGMVGQSPKIDEEVERKHNILLEKLINESDNESIKIMKEEGKLTVKVGLQNIYADKRQYVFRNVSSITPLRDAIQAYLDGATVDEEKQGYITNTLGIKDFNIKIKNHTAYINFRSENLEIKSPQDVVDFDHNITRTAKQFPNIKYVQICINGISNYQTTFFANEPIQNCYFQ